MLAEFFDQKLYSLGAMGAYAYLQHFPDDLDKITGFQLLANNVIFESIIMSWAQKVKYDQVRPFSTVRKVFDDIIPQKTIRSYGGPYQGTVDISPDEWKSYLVTDPHPEYPSGTACVCAVWTTAARLYFGTDVLNYTAIYPKGSSIFEPGATPATDLAVPLDTFTTVNSICGKSRQWAGVHFSESVRESQRVCPKIAQIAYEHVQRLLNGDISWKTW